MDRLSKRAASFFDARHSKRRPTRRAIFLFVAALLSAAFTNQTHAALEVDGSSDQEYINAGRSLAGKLLAFKILVPGVGTGERDTSATFLNSSYALTAAHNIKDLLSFNPTYVAGAGSNYLSDFGSALPIDSVLLYPGYDASAGPAGSIDLAILHFTSPVQAPAATIAAPSAGEVLLSGGFGATGTPSTGLISPRDGYGRGWNADVDPLGPVMGDSRYYFGQDFGDDSRIPLNGKGESGDSGGPSYDAAGDLIGIDIAQSGGTSQFGQTIALQLSRPDIQLWIAANTSVPETQFSLALSAIALCGAMRLRSSHVRNKFHSMQFGYDGFEGSQLSPPPTRDM